MHYLRLAKIIQERKKLFNGFCILRQMLNIFISHEAPHKKRQNLRYDVTAFVFVECSRRNSRGVIQ